MKPDMVSGCAMAERGSLLLALLSSGLQVVIGYGDCIEGLLCRNVVVMVVSVEVMMVAALWGELTDKRGHAWAAETVAAVGSRNVRTASAAASASSLVGQIVATQRLSNDFGCGSLVSLVALSRQTDDLISYQLSFKSNTI